MMKKKKQKSPSEVSHTKLYHFRNGSLVFSTTKGTTRMTFVTGLFSDPKGCVYPKEFSGFTDWDKVDAMTDEQLDVEDPDSPEATEEQLEKITRALRDID